MPLDGVRFEVPRSASVGLEGVTKRYGDATAVDTMTLEIGAGEFLVLLGPSGCGKTTALRLVAGLEEPTTGLIRIDGEVVNDIDAKDRDVAMVFQSYALYPHLTVRRNIEFPLRARHVAAEDRSRLIAEVSTSLQIADLLDRRPAEISGGQRQRVALARAIVRQPRVFLMDEPLSNLDAQLRVEMRAELVELHERLGTTILYVTHDQVEAMTMGDRIAIMERGVLQQVGIPQEVHDRPANAFVAGFIGSPPMNILRGALATTGGAGDMQVVVAGGGIPLPDPLAAVTRRRGLTSLIVGVRPEHVVIDPGGTLSASVMMVEALGHENHVACRLEGGKLIMVRLATGEPIPRPGERVMLSFPGGRLQLFDPVTEVRLDV